MYFLSLMSWLYSDEVFPYVFTFFVILVALITIVQCVHNWASGKLYDLRHAELQLFMIHELARQRYIQNYLCKFVLEGKLTEEELDTIRSWLE